MSNVRYREGASAAAIGMRSTSVQGMYMTAPLAVKCPECANTIVCWASSAANHAWRTCWETGCHHGWMTIHPGWMPIGMEDQGANLRNCTNT